MVDTTPQVHMHFAQVAPSAPFVARTTRYGRTGWYRRADYLSIATVVAGQGRLGCAVGKSDIRFQDLARGTTLLLRPRDITTIEGTGSDRLSISYVAFPVASWRSFAGLTGLEAGWATDPFPPVARISPDDPDGEPAFRVAIDRFHASPTTFDLVRFWASLVPQLVGLSPTAATAPSGVPGWLAESVGAMRLEANLRGGVPRFLELARVTSGHLASVTRRFYACTPTELVAELRLRHATDLLRTTTDSVGEIAARCGYSSLVYFSGRFRQAYAMSPREYRQSMGTPVDLDEFDNFVELTTDPE